ncbi:MAG: uncharacterized protein JWO36_1297 [Myxococcales bacterium]|nr:uncharacterized protein [Myxococcales bacterium]
MKLFACVSYFAPLVLCAACGSKSPATTTTTPTPTATVVLPDVAFDKLDHDQRIEFMKQKVMPAMEPLFKQHDAKMFADFGCKTCHGKGAETGHFDMPNAELPKLDIADMSKFKKEDLEWMAKDIKPTMAKLVQQAEWTPDNPKGFGCAECHTLVQPPK